MVYGQKEQERRWGSLSNRGSRKRRHSRPWGNEGGEEGKSGLPASGKRASPAATPGLDKDLAPFRWVLLLWEPSLPGPHRFLVSFEMLMLRKTREQLQSAYSVTKFLVLLIGGRATITTHANQSVFFFFLNTCRGFSI